MWRMAPVRGCVPALAMVALISAPALAQNAKEAQESTPRPANLECHSGAIEGSGPGFTSSREKSEQAARENWLEKAKAVFPDANWDLAQDANLSCAVQGLYSKCFASGVPCKPKE